MGFFKALSLIVQAFLAIPKVANVIEKVVKLIQKQIELKKEKDREKEINKAIDSAIKDKDASKLEDLLTRANNAFIDRKEL